MSYAPARARSRAPWIAILLVPLLALASVLVPTAPASAAPGDVAGATLQWGFKASFRSYLTGGIAHGHATGTGVDTATPYGWSGGTGTASGGTGTVGYPGTLQFQGHEATGVPAGEYALDVTITDVRVRVTSATTAELQADVVSRSMTTLAFESYPDVVLATLDLAAGTNASTSTTLAYTNVPAVLTAAGAPAFAGFYPAGTALDPVSFSWPVEQAPIATVAVTSATQAGGLEVTVTGSQFTGITAAYVSIIEKGSEYTYIGAAQQIAIADGAFTQALVAPLASLTKDKHYEVLVWKTRTNPSSSTIYARADITPTAEQWKTLFPPVPTLATPVTAASAADGLTVGVAGTEFDGITAAYVSIIEKGSEYTYIGAAKQVAITDGVFSQPLVAPAASLDKTKQYEVIAWKTRTNPSASTIYARADITVTPEQWNAIFPPPVPTLGVTVTGATASGGLEISVAGTIFEGITASYLSIIEKGSEYTYIGAAKQLAITDGSFTAPLAAPTASLDKTKQYEVIAWKTRTNPSASTIYARADITVTPEQWNAIFPPPVPTLTVDITGATKTSGISLDVHGTSFEGVTAAYAAIIEKGEEAGVGQSSGTIGAAAQITSIVNGEFTQALVAPTAQLDRTRQYEVIVWKTRSLPTSATIYARADLTVSSAQWDALFPPAVTLPVATPGAGSLSWGVKASFRSYVTGPIAHGAISTTGASSASGAFVFPQSGAAQLTDGLGTVAYSGSVRFTGHDGVLDLRLSDPQVRIDSATSGTLLLRVNGGSSVAFASLALGSGTKTTDATGAVRYADVPATLTSAGSGAFSFEGSTFYPAGTVLDPVTFVVGSASSSPAGTVVVASAAKKTGNTADPTPPASTGVTVTDGQLVEGGEVTAEADGFQPGESGILVVIYSTPTVLAENVTADADGRVSWTGTLPRGLTGEHTLTFQGSVDRGIVLDIAAATELQCTVSDATLVWGFKESFRAYIDGSIANGEWTTDGDVSYSTPEFTWTGGAGGADEDGALDVQYSGSVRFTGHGGVLDTTVANPRVVIDGDRAVLLLDITGTTQEGEAVEATAVEFAELDLAAVESTVDGDVTTWAEVPATLTAAGAAAFGTYPEGEELDPVTITATVESGCASAAAEPTADATDDAIAPEPTASEGWPAWATILIVALLVAAIIATVVIVLVRRRRA